MHFATSGVWQFMRTVRHALIYMCLELGTLCDPANGTDTSPSTVLHCFNAGPTAIRPPRRPPLRPSRRAVPSATCCCGPRPRPGRSAGAAGCRRTRSRSSPASCAGRWRWACRTARRCWRCCCPPSAVARRLWAVCLRVPTQVRAPGCLRPIRGATHCLALLVILWCNGVTLDGDGSLHPLPLPPV